MDRRGALAGCLALCALPARADAPAPSLIDDVTTYARFGDQQTGSLAGRQTEGWVAARLEALGFTTTRQSVTYPALLDASASLQTEGGLMAGIPQMPAAQTSRDGLEALLTFADRASDLAQAQGSIGVINLPFGRHSSILDQRIARAIDRALLARLSGIVLVTHGPSGDAIALNAPVAHALASVPAMVMAPRDLAIVNSAVEAGRPGILRVSGRLATVQGHNIIARRKGTGRTIVVTTPLSGWFACAGERGSGIAAFLAFARDVRRAQPEADLLFVGLVGHERENAGGLRFLEALAPAPDLVRLWVHVGANFAARDWQEAGETLLPMPSADSQRFLLASDAYLPTLREALRQTPGFAVPYPARVANAAGEARHILAKGYERMISNFGAHRLHHSRRDTIDAVDSSSLNATYEAWRTGVLAVLSGPARD